MAKVKSVKAWMLKDEADYSFFLRHAGSNPKEVWQSFFEANDFGDMNMDQFKKHWEAEGYRVVRVTITEDERRKK